MRHGARLAVIGPSRLVVLSAAIVFFVFAATRIWAFSVASAGVDFYHFWGVPAAARAGVREVYSGEGRTAFATFMAERARQGSSRRLAVVQGYWEEPRPTGSPLLYAFFRATTGADYEADYRRYQAWSSALAVLALLVLGHLLLIPLAPLLLLVAALAFVCTPLADDLMVANVNRLMLAPLVGYAALRFLAWRDRRAAWSLASGLVMALCILFKPVFALAVLTIGLNRLVWRQFRELALEAAGATLGLVLAAGITLQLYGTLAVWGDWAASAPAMLSSYLTDLSVGNLAPRLWLQSLLGAAGTGICLAVAAIVLCAQFAALRSRVTPRSADELARADLIALGLAFVLYVWVSQLVWAHYYTLALPWLLLGLEAGRRRQAAPVALVVLAMLALEFGTAAAATAAAAPLTLALLLMLWPAAAVMPLSPAAPAASAG